MPENAETITALVKALAQKGDWDQAREECNLALPIPEVVGTEKFAQAVKQHTHAKYVIGYLRSVEFLTASVEKLQEIIETGETKDKLTAMRILRQIHRDLADAGFLLHGQLQVESEISEKLYEG